MSTNAVRFILACLSLTWVGCTRTTNHSSKIRISVPAQEFSVLKSSTDVSNQSTSATSWGLADPTLSSEINCYAVFVSGPEAALSQNKCSKSDGTELMRVGAYAGGVPSGGTLEIEIASGDNRTVHLVGLKVSDASQCRSFSDLELSRSSFSKPMILDTRRLSVAAGDQTIDMTVKIDSEKSFDSCSGPLFLLGLLSDGTSTSPTPPIATPAPTLTSISPAIGSPSGGTLVTLIGTNFTATSVVTINGTACGSLTFTSANQVSCITTTTAPGTYNVRVTNANALSAELASAYTFAPVPLAVAQIEGGKNFTCARFTNNKVKCWGLASYGSLGQENTTMLGDDESISSVPFINFGTNRTVVKLSVGEKHACVLLDNNSVKCWGDGSLGNGKLGFATSSIIGDGPSEMGDSLQSVNFAPVTTLYPGSYPVDVGAGGEHSCAFINNGTIWCWGMDGGGELGDGGTTNTGATVREVSGVTAATKMSIGGSHSCAIDASTVKCWGSNSNGQLGNGTTTDAYSPVTISLGGTPVDVFTNKAWTGTSYFSCAIISGGGVKCWGANPYGQLGDGTTTQRTSPTAVNGLSSGVVTLGLGVNSTCAGLSDGSAKCWGIGSYGRLGKDSGSSSPNPDVVLALTGIVNITGGDAHHCALLNSQKVRCWGYNMYGQLGYGNVSNLGDAPGEMGGLTDLDLGSE